MIIDIHAHFPWGNYSHLEDVDVFLRRARRFHVDRVCLSGNVAQYGFNPTARQVRELNRWTLRCMARHPEEIIGLCFINPAVGADAACREIDRAITEQLRSGIVFGHPHPLEAEVARMLKEVVPCAKRVRFLKTGGEAVAACIQIARHSTLRTGLCT